MAGVIDATTSQMGKFRDSIEKLELSKIGKDAGVVGKSFRKLGTILGQTGVGHVVKAAYHFGVFTNRMAGFYKTTTQARREARKMTILQKMLSGVMKQTGAYKLAASSASLLQAQFKGMNKFLHLLILNFSRFAFMLFGMLSIFAMVAITLGVFAIAMTDANGPIQDWVEDIPLLEEAVDGLYNILGGEGEGGLTGAINLVAAAFVLGAAASILFWSAAAGPLVAALILAVGVFDLMLSATGSLDAALLYACATMGVFIVLLAPVVPMFSGIATAVASVVAWCLSLIPGVTASGSALATTGTLGMMAFAAIGAGFALLIGYATGATGWIGGLIGAILLFIGILLMIPVAAIGGVTIAVAAIIALVAWFIADIIRNWGHLGETWSGRLNSMVSFLTGILNSVSTKVGEIVDGITTKITSMKIIAIALILGLVTTASDMWNNFTSSIGEAISLVGFDNMVKGVVTLMNGLIEGVNLIPGVNIPLLAVGGEAERAFGGSVTSGRSYIVGEKGPERFTPDTGGDISPGGGGGAITLNINVAGVTDRTDKRELARQIGDMLNQELRRQGGATTRGRF